MCAGRGGVNDSPSLIFVGFTSAIIAGVLLAMLAGFRSLPLTEHGAAVAMLVLSIIVVVGLFVAIIGIFKDGM